MKEICPSYGPSSWSGEYDVCCHNKDGQDRYYINYTNSNSEVNHICECFPDKDLNQHTGIGSAFSVATLLCMLLNHHNDEYYTRKCNEIRKEMEVKNGKKENKSSCSTSSN